MKKLLIFVDNIGPKKKMFAQLISERLGSEVKVVLAKFSDVSIEISEGTVKTSVNDYNLKDFNLVYFRRIDHSIFPLSHTLALLMDKFRIKYFDTTYREVGAGGDKVTSLVKLALSGIPVPKTVFVTRENIIKNADKIISTLNLPIIAKDTRAQGNKGIYVIRKKEDFHELLDSNKIRPTGSPIQFLFQEFIDIDKEYRLLVLKDKVGTAHTKVKRKYDQIVIGWEDINSQPEFVDPNILPNSLKIAAIKAAKALNVEIAGVDGCIAKNSDKPIILEVNRGPGFEYDTKKSPEIPAVADFLKKELNQ